MDLVMIVGSLGFGAGAVMARGRIVAGLIVVGIVEWDGCCYLL